MTIDNRVYMFAITRVGVSIGIINNNYCVGVLFHTSCAILAFDSQLCVSNCGALEITVAASSSGACELQVANA